MNARRFALLAALVALPFALGCTASLEAPREKAEALSEEGPKGDQRPVAPMPREKKTTAELLLGKWKVVERDDRAVPAKGKYYLEFTADDKLHISTEDQVFPLKVVTGTYKLDGETFHFHTLADKQGEERRWKAKINSITGDWLAFTVEQGSLSGTYGCRKMMNAK